jgi:hypothetical protein
MNKDNGGPAFPVLEVTHDETYQNVEIQHGGMTLRDYFAAKALSLTASCFTQEELATWDYRHFAEHAYGVADAMLLESAQ